MPSGTSSAPRGRTTSQPMYMQGSGTHKSAFQRFWTPGRMLVVFVCVNLINYIDRFVIAGCTSELEPFVREDMHVAKPDTWIGATQSAFIGGYAASSLVFGHLVHHFHPFRLMAIGLLAWCGAVVLTGLAPHVWVMILARVISGVGEASFQCIVPPYIDDHAPPEKRGLWLALFFMAIPVGSAIGFGYGAAVAASPLTWRGAYVMEAIVMAPLAMLVFCLPYDGRARSDTDDGEGDLADKVVPSDTSEYRLASDADDKLRRASEYHKIHPAHEARPTVMQEFMSVVSSPPFIAASIGYAAYTFVTAGFATWGANFLMKLGLFAGPGAEERASLTFGGIVSVTGAIGTPVGGVLLDRYADKLRQQRLRKMGAERGGVDGDGRVGRDDVFPAEEADDPGEMSDKLYASFTHLVMYAVLGTVLCTLSALLVNTPALFYPLIALGCLSLFASTSATNLAIMSSVPSQSRSFAIGINTILIHSLGDVPSPPILGYLVDSKSPQLVLTVLCMYLAWVIVFWGIGYVMALRRRTAYLAHHSGLLSLQADKSDAYVPPTL